MTNRNISHIEIPAMGRPELAKFYADTFGWKTQAMDAMGAKYTVFQSGNIRGGFPDVNLSYQPGDIILYLDSDDIDADLKTIEANGGKTLLQKTEIPGIGWYAHFADPTGNRMALFMVKKE